MKDKLQVGVVGLGRMGQVHLNHLINNPSCEVVLLIDKDYDKVLETAKRLSTRGLKLPSAFDSVEPFISSDIALDAVVIASSTYTHAEYTKLFSSYGINVFVEKPLASNLEEARKVIKYLDEIGRQVMVGFMRRLFEPFVEAKSLVADGVIGNLTKVVYRLSDKEPPPKGYDSAGVARDMGTHGGDLLRNITGSEMEEIVSAYGDNKGPYKNRGKPGIELCNEDYDTFGFVVRFKNGVVGEVELKRYDGYEDSLTLVGDNGSISAVPFHEDERIIELRIYDRNGRPVKKKSYDLVGYEPNNPPFFNRYVKTSYRIELEKFVNQCLEAGALGKPTFAPNQHDGIASQEMIESAYTYIQNQSSKMPVSK